MCVKEKTKNLQKGRLGNKNMKSPHKSCSKNNPNNPIKTTMNNKLRIYPLMYRIDFKSLKTHYDKETFVLMN